jgi:N-acetylglucosamine-6-phosphate deacetylase
LNYIDLQVNGFGGVSFSDEGLTTEGIQSVCVALFERGTEAFCPTVVTTSPAAYRSVLPLLARAAAKNASPGDKTQAAILGIHLEGPFISPEDGAVGVHPREYTRNPSLADFDELYSLADGRIVLLTLAPELPDALELIRHTVSLGVTVSLGHTLADSAIIHAAV